MRIENIIIIAVVAGLLYFGVLKQAGKARDVTSSRQLPPPGQTADGDGGAARALISEGIDQGAGILNNLINHAFQRSQDAAPPETQSMTI